MIFDFRLTPIEQIHPWGEPPNQNLSWFGFSDGSYRLKVGSDYLLNYSDEYINYLIRKFPECSFDTTFVDYQIVRLWEDILEMLSSIIEPVPKEIQYFFISGYENYLELQNRLLDWEDSEITKGVKESDALTFGELAICWLDDRRLNNQYLTNSARIWIWSDEEDVIFSWDNREIKVEEIPVWSATQGNYRISKKDFINEVEEFDRSFISEMAKRVATICQNWNEPEIKVDFEHLKSEQNNRATWFKSSLNRIYKTDWDKVISAIKIINP